MTAMLLQLLVSTALYTGDAQYSGWRSLASRARVSLRAKVILQELSACSRSVAGAAMAAARLTKLLPMDADPASTKCVSYRRWVCV
jgi:hypothetical protein